MLTVTTKIRKDRKSYTLRAAGYNLGTAYKNTNGGFSFIKFNYPICATIPENLATKTMAELKSILAGNRYAQEAAKSQEAWDARFADDAKKLEGFDNQPQFA